MPTTFDKKFKSESHYGGRVRKTTAGNYVAERSTKGKLRRWSFKNRSAAIAKLKELGEQRDKHGQIVTQLKADEIRDAIDALKRLKEAGQTISLCEAVDDYNIRHPVSDETPTFQDVVDMHLVSMRARNCRPESVTGTRKILTMVAKHLGGQRVYTDITPEELQRMVDGWQVADRTKKNRVQEMRTLFLYAESEKNLRNPVPDGIKLKEVKRDEKPATVMSPADVARFLEWVEQNKPERHALAYAVQFFAGVRPRGEMTRMTLESIRWNEKNSIGGKGVIRLEGKDTKTRDMRKIPITPNLRKWLLRYTGKGKGKLSPAYSGLSATRQEACKKLGLEWAPDITRHSFATAAGERYGQAEAIEWLGHEQSSRMFKKHYEGVYDHEEAEQFFLIEPTPAKGGKVIQLEASA